VSELKLKHILSAILMAAIGFIAGYVVCLQNRHTFDEDFDFDDDFEDEEE
jgi:hypothetical protein